MNTPTLNPIFDYFRSIGIDGKIPDQWVTDDFALVPKPTWLQRVLADLRGRQNTRIPKVLIKLDDILRAIGPDEQGRILFVKGVLENIWRKRDPHLKNLAILNEILNYFPNANETQVVKSQYLSTGTINSKLDVVRRFNIVKYGKWLELPLDLIAKIFSFVGLRDHFRAQATCRKWYIAAARHDAFSPCLLTPEERLYISTLRKTNPFTLIEAIRKNRRLIAAVSTGKISEKSICPTYFSEKIYQCNPIGGDHIIVRDKDCFYSVQNDCVVQVPHEYREEYEVVLAQSENRIFVINKDKDTLYSIEEVDPITGDKDILCEPNLAMPFVRHMAYHQKKIWMVTGEGSMHIFDLETMELGPDTWAPKPNGAMWPHHYTHVRHIYTSPQAPYTFEVEDLTDHTKASHVIPNSQDCSEFLANTTNALYVHRFGNIVALDVETGQTLQRCSHSSFFFTPRVQESNGMLYAFSMHKLYVFDLLTGKSIGTNATVYQNPQVVGNKVFSLKLGIFGSHEVYELSPADPAKDVFQSKNGHE